MCARGSSGQLTAALLLLAAMAAAACVSVPATAGVQVIRGAHACTARIVCALPSAQHAWPRLQALSCFAAPPAMPHPAACRLGAISSAELGAAHDVVRVWAAVHQGQVSKFSESFHRAARGVGESVGRWTERAPKLCC